MTINPKLLDTLLDLHKNSRSGVLRAEKGKDKKQLVLDKGSLVFAESNLPGDHLAQIMVKIGVLPQAKLKEIAALMKSGKTSEQAILAVAKSGMQDLGKGRREQATVILASLWGWETCDLHFYPGESLVRYQLNLGIPLPELLVLSVRRAVSDRLISVPPDFMKGRYSIAWDFAETAMGLPLSSTESYVYTMLHDPQDVANIIPLIPPSEAKPQDLLLRLFALGMIARPSEPAIQVDNASEGIDPNSPAQQLDDMLVRFETASLCEMLSVSAEASPDEIQTAYYDLAKQFHPDRFQSKDFSPDILLKAQRVFTHINEAYMVLKDPAARAGYDETRLTKESRVEAARAAAKSEDEKTAAGLFHEGRSLLAQGDFEKAVERLKGSVWLRPEKAAYNHYLGVAESQIPRFRKSAEQHLLKAIELDSTSIASHLELAKLYIKVALRRKAEHHLQELMRWDPANREAIKLFDELKRNAN